MGASDPRHVDVGFYCRCKYLHSQANWEVQLSSSC